MSFPADEGWRELDDGTFLSMLGQVFARPAEEGVEIELIAGAELRNLSGAVHGGALMTLLDRVCGMSARTHAGGHRVATASITVSFLRPVAVGARVTLRGRVRRSGRQSFFTDAEAHADGALVATATAIFLRVLDPEPPADTTPVSHRVE